MCKEVSSNSNSNSMSRRTHILISVIICWMATTGIALSQPLIEEEQRLNFGTLAVASNASISRFNYPYTGNNVSIEGEFVRIASGTPGRYRFTGFPANTALDITVNNTSLTPGGSGIPELLSVDNYNSIQLTTDSQGEAELLLGARLNTSGNTGSYVDAPYSGTTSIRVDYWQPAVNAYVFNTQSIELEAELRSTLTLDVDQPLNFGTLFAQSSDINQAALMLSPSGSYSISEPGNSRLVSLAKPEQGIIRVTGAAPNYLLNITPQSSDVLLEHSLFPGSAPHFVLSNLVTSPEVTGTSDSNGELVINVAGTLKTELTTSPEIYPSGQYNGTYQLTVSY